MNLKIPQSFFDDLTQPEFWTKSKPPPLDLPSTFTDSMHIIKGTDLLKRKFSLIDNYLLQHKENNIKWLNLNNITAQLIRNPCAGQGIKLTKNGRNFEFFGDVEVWFNYMKRYCILTNFQSSYMLVKKIGSGNFAQVFKAQHKLDSTEYAVKCFQKTTFKTRDDQLSVIKEIAILRKIQHDSILRLYEVYETDDHINLVLELLKGGELYRYLKVSPPFSEDKCAKVIYKLLHAVSYIHQKGILHRDIKPENLILRNKDDIEDICIADFGLADYYNSDGKYLFTRCGTPGYVAPELLHDQIYDYKIDVFSVGILMYLLITGHPPFEGNDYDQVVMKNYKGKVDFDKVKISEQGKQLMMGLLQIDPFQRFTAQEALNHHWFVQEKQSKSCQFKVRKQNNYLKKFAQFELNIKPKSQNLTPQSPLSSLSPQLSKYNLDDSPKTPGYSPRPPQRVIRKSIFNFK